jgi:hypothetical protein
VCYPTTTDSATIYLPSNTIQPFYFYVYTDGTVDTARVRVGFRNVNNPNNQSIQNLFGVTTFFTDVPENVFDDHISIYPNPSLAEQQRRINITLFSPRSIISVMIFDLTGRVISASIFNSLSIGTNQLELQHQNFRSGSYLLRIIADNEIVFNEKLTILN